MQRQSLKTGTSHDTDLSLLTVSSLSMDPSRHGMNSKQREASPISTLNLR